MGVGRWKHKSLMHLATERSPCTRPRKAPAGPCLREVSRLGGQPATQSIAVGLEVTGPPWLLPAEGFLRCWVPPILAAHLLLGVPAMGFLREGASSHPQGPTIATRPATFWAPHPGFSPLPEAGSGQGLRRLWAPALGLLEPISLALLLDGLSLSWGAGALSRTRDAGTQSGLSPVPVAWATRLRSSALSPPLPCPGGRRLIIRFQWHTCSGPLPVKRARAGKARAGPS